MTKLEKKFNKTITEKEPVPIEVIHIEAIDEKDIEETFEIIKEGKELCSEKTFLDILVFRARISQEEAIKVKDLYLKNKWIKQNQKGKIVAKNGFVYHKNIILGALKEKLI